MPTAEWVAIGGAAWGVAAFVVAVLTGRLASLAQEGHCRRCGGTCPTAVLVCWRCSPVSAPGP